MKTILRLAMVLVLLGVVYVGISPFIAMYQIKQAVDKQDTDSLMKYVDTTAIAKGFKEQVSQEAKASLGAYSSLLGKHVDKIMQSGVVADVLNDQENQEYWVKNGLQIVLESIHQTKQPSLADISRQEQANDAQSKDARNHQTDTSRVRWHYTNFNTFTVLVPSKEHDNEMIKLLFSRQQLTHWRLTHITVPHFMDLLKNKKRPF